MDFRRIEWLFLVAFIVIDIFLFIAFQRDTDVQTATSTGRTADTDATIVKEMRSDQITMQHLSDKAGYGYYISSTDNGEVKRDLSSLQNQTVRYVDGAITATFKTPITNVDPKHPNVVLDTVVKDSSLILFGSQYKYNPQLSSANTVVYTQRVADNQSVYSRSGQLRFSLTNSGNVISYNQGFLDNVQTLREKTETISPRKALIWLYQYNQIPNNTDIEWVHLAYTRYFELKDSSVYIPTWVVAMKANSGSNAGVEQIKRVNAFTGAVLSQNSNLKTISGTATTSE